VVSAGTSKKPPELREARFQKADVGKGNRGHPGRVGEVAQQENRKASKEGEQENRKG
jgi:hypothetical protein